MTNEVLWSGGTGFQCFGETDLAREAVEIVLKDSADPMHYTDIAEEIAALRLRGEDLGATPANTVVMIITVSLRDEGINSPFVRVERGVYGLREKVRLEALSNAGAEAPTDDTEISSEVTGLVNAFGMFWDRMKVAWAVQPKILGQQERSCLPESRRNEGRRVSVLAEPADVGADGCG